jgi:hypothetical protein
MYFGKCSISISIYIKLFLVNLPQKEEPGKEITCSLGEETVIIICLIFCIFKKPYHKKQALGKIFFELLKIRATKLAFSFSLFFSSSQKAFNVQRFTINVHFCSRVL